MSARRRRWVRTLVALALPSALAAALPPLRVGILRAAGRALVVDDPLEPADIVVIAIDADGAGVLEAADLVQAGIAPRVAVFADPPDAVDREFLRRGLPYEDAAARAVRQLRSLNVAAVELIPMAVTGTGHEGPPLPRGGGRRGLRSIPLV